LTIYTLLIMTQQEKKLLLKDLCARLTYGIKCYYNSPEIDDDIPEGISVIKGFKNEGILIEIESGDIIDVDCIKPYLRSMSSMTKEEKHKLLKFGAITSLENGEVVDVSCVGFERHANIQDYLNACHFDYRGLIQMGLALEATEGMYNIK